MITITSYKNPDIDGVAGMYALTELYEMQGIKCNYFIDRTPQFEVDIICKKFNIALCGNKKNNQDDEIILLDCNDLSKVNKNIKKEKVIKVIDHHTPSKGTKQLINAELKIEQVGAMATLIVEKYLKLNKKLSKESAILLYFAIASNTVNLKAPVTTERDKKAMNYLHNLYPKILNRENIKQIFQEKSEIKDIERTVLSDLKLFNNEIIIGQLEITNARHFIKNNKRELIRILDQIKNTHKVQGVILNIIDILEGYNIIMFADETEPVKKIISRLNLTNSGNTLKTKNIVMRKEIARSK
ncbi:MAG: DHH family phosphoesterase [Clostridia bacterium]|nr:DHH family phosphoesterase [Clostridia bacterium]